jgi:type II secretion system protein N
MLERIRALADSAARFNFGQIRSRTAGYAAFGIVLFLVFFVSNFPYGEALSSALASFNLTLTYREQHASLPLGTELSGVRLAAITAPQEAPIIDNANIYLAPTVTSLLLARPGLYLSAELYGGTVNATLYRKGGIAELSLNATGLELGRYDALARMGINTSGRVSLDGSASIHGADWPKDNATVRITLAGFMFRAARGLPAIRIGKLAGTLSLADGTVHIDDVAGSGGDLHLHVSGTIQLESYLPNSSMDLRVTIEPTPTGAKHLATLFALLPHEPGPRPFIVRGRFDSPSIT